jgi:hypothetical protein
VGHQNTGKDLVAVAVTTDGRRVPVRYRETIPADELSVRDLLRLVGLGLLGLIGLITGSRREPGGRRGDSR